MPTDQDGLEAVLLALTDLGQSSFGPEGSEKSLIDSQEMNRLRDEFSPIKLYPLFTPIFLVFYLLLFSPPVHLISSSLMFIRQVPGLSKRRCAASSVSA